MLDNVSQFSGILADVLFGSDTLLTTAKMPAWKIQTIFQNKNQIDTYVHL